MKTRNPHIIDVAEIQSFLDTFEHQLAAAQVDRGRTRVRSGEEGTAPTHKRLLLRAGSPHFMVRTEQNDDRFIIYVGESIEDAVKHYNDLG